ncbi:uncharacterized protein LOC104421813 [Eucalyptus grandis]|uniref:uncharacterized protein LOC104421813 n=1 Tax=Eucalyptus grandis TaxID=71139 RepID=UPI00192EDACB|nr:uncharacterized protein LOC104421813 [Eucalyptus grandis]
MNGFCQFPNQTQSSYIMPPSNFNGFSPFTTQMLEYNNRSHGTILSQGSSNSFQHLGMNEPEAPVKAQIMHGRNINSLEEPSYSIVLVLFTSLAKRQLIGLAVSSKHTYMFSAGDDKRVKCWDLDQNKVIRSSHGLCTSRSES